MAATHEPGRVPYALLRTGSSARRLSLALPMAIAMVAVVGCSGSAPDTGAPSDTAPVGDGTLEVSVADDNSLVADVGVDTPTATEVVLEVSSADTDPRRLTSEGVDTSHEFTVVGLRADTEYTFEASTPDGPSGSGSVTTGALPDTAPRTELVGAAADPSAPDAGITFFGVTAKGTYEEPEVIEGPIFYGVDPQGYIVWYMNNEQPPNRAPIIRDGGNGTMLVFNKASIQRITLDGEVTETYDMSAVPAWHHDAVFLPDGGMLALSAETRKIDGRDVHGDTVVELDDAGAVVSEWSTLDHLDTTRFPGVLANELAGAGGLDWTHGNSVVYSEERNEIVISLRSQGWVVAYDRDSGELTWIAGDDKDTAPDFDAPFLELLDGTWTSGQHAATFAEDGDLLVYDNRNETGGEENLSRAVAYELDLDAMTATQNFEYVAPKNTKALGDVDELDGGNVLVAAGGLGSDDTARLVEVDEQAEPVWEVDVTDTWTYRSERLPWAEVDRAAG